MSEAIHLSVLVCLLTATLCSGSNVSTTTEQRIPTTASTLLTTKTSNGSTPQLQTTAHQVATEAVSSPPGTQGMGETSPSSPSSRTQTTLITTPNATVFQEHTASPASGTPNVTTNTTLHTTSQVSSPIWIKGDLGANPGLIAIICIFCIILGMTLVVLAVKCIQSPRSNFERLEDVPLD
ncbi:putative LOC729966 homolog isoform X2 [Oryzias latipes]